MSDKSVKKVDSTYSPTGKMGQKYLVSGKEVSMRLWKMSRRATLAGEATRL